MDENMIEPSLATVPASRAPKTFLAWLLGTVELVLAAALSMLLVDQVTSPALPDLGLTWLTENPFGLAVLMTFDITVGTAVWMMHRRRSARAILAMVVAVAVGFALPLLPYAIGLLSAPNAVLIGHLLVMPALAIAVALLPGDLGVRSEPRSSA
jgi:hypothetical protein